MKLSELLKELEEKEEKLRFLGRCKYRLRSLFFDGSDPQYKMILWSLRQSAQVKEIRVYSSEE